MMYAGCYACLNAELIEVKGERGGLPLGTYPYSHHWLSIDAQLEKKLPSAATLPQVLFRKCRYFYDWIFQEKRSNSILSFELDLNIPKKTSQLALN